MRKYTCLMIIFHAIRILTLLGLNFAILINFFIFFLRLKANSDDSGEEEFSADKEASLVINHSY